MDIKRIFYIATCKWWLIILLIGLGGGLGYLNTVFAPTLYNADLTLYVMNRDKVLAGKELTSQDLTMSQLLVKQYSGIWHSRAVISAVVNSLANYNISEDQLLSMVSIKNEADTNLLTVSATSPDPEIAAAVANAMGKEVTSQFRLLTQGDYIGIVDNAKVPQSPVHKNAMKKILLSMITGLLIALGIIYIIEYYYITIISGEDIEKRLNLQVIGVIPEHGIEVRK